MKFPETLFQTLPQELQDTYTPAMKFRERIDLHSVNLLRKHAADLDAYQTALDKFVRRANRLISQEMRDAIVQDIRKRNA